MRRGKITFSWEDEPGQEAELNLPTPRPAAKPAATFNKPTAASFDVSAIRDRVLQMEMGEEVVLDGTSLDDHDHDQDQDTLRIIQQAKEARAKMREKQDTVAVEEDDYLPVTSSGQYWLKRDVQDAEEAFHSSSHSRLVREDLVHDRDDSADVEGFTSFAGGLSKRILEKDLKSGDFYTAAASAEAADDSDEEVAAWQAAQARKGMEKGWRPLGEADSSDGFLARQSKLASHFTAPKQLEPPLPIDTVLQAESAQLEKLKATLQEIEENCARMRLDQVAFDFGRFDTAREKAKLASLQQLHQVVSQWTAFLSEREAELEALLAQTDGPLDLIQDAWEHFFDDVEGEQLVLLNSLPWHCSFLQQHLADEQLSREVQAALVHLVGFFCKYHLMKERFTSQDRSEILAECGLQAILDALDEETRTMILR